MTTQWLSPPMSVTRQARAAAVVKVRVPMSAIRTSSQADRQVRAAIAATR